jgi:hypothetical protein
MQEHRHHHLLTDIVHKLRTSQATLHLWKVTSHTGIYGNDMADDMAVEVATERQAPTTTDQVQSNARATYYWPHSIEDIATQTGTRRESTPLANLAETLKTTAKRNCAPGGANTDGVYFKAWEDQDRHIQHKYSHMFMRRRTVQHRTSEILQVLKQVSEGV